MDNIFTNIMGLESGNYVAVYGGVRKHSDFTVNHLNLCSKDERRSYGFGTTWGRV